MSIKDKLEPNVSQSATCSIERSKNVDGVNGLAVQVMPKACFDDEPQVRRSHRAYVGCVARGPAGEKRSRWPIASARISWACCWSLRGWSGSDRRSRPRPRAVAVTPAFSMAASRASAGIRRIEGAIAWSTAIPVASEEQIASGSQPWRATSRPISAAFICRFWRRRACAPGSVSMSRSAPHVETRGAKLTVS